MKNILKKRLERLMAKKTDLSSRAMASEDAAEIRSIGEQLKELNEEIKDINDEIANLEKEEEEKRASQPVAVPANAVPVNGDIRGAFGVANPTEKKKTNENPLASTEYRSGHAGYVQRGEKISADIIKSIDEYRSSLPVEQRANVPATTADTGAAIPLTIMREIINTVRKRYGNLYARFARCQFRAALNSRSVLSRLTSSGSQKEQLHHVRTSVLSARYLWVSYSRNPIAQSFLSQILTIEAFEEEITKVIAIAYLKAMDFVILNGSGDGQPLGILNDARVAATGNANHNGCS